MKGKKMSFGSKQSKGPGPGKGHRQTGADKISRNRKGPPPTRSWEKAPSMRRDGLVDEFLKRKKTSVVVDSRIGERSRGHVAEEEKIARRLAKEKTKQYKTRVNFNLPDDDDEGLTHKGLAIDQMERYDDPRDHSGSEDELLDEDFVGEAHFGGFLKMKTKEGPEVGEDGKEKSRKDIIEELILANKAKKLEKAKQGDEYLSKVGALNALFKDQSLLSLVQTSRTKKQEMQDLLSPLTSKGPLLEEPVRKPVETRKPAEPIMDPNDRAFGTLVRELKFESKPARVEPADPSVRIKTDPSEPDPDANATPLVGLPAQIPASYGKYLAFLSANMIASSDSSSDRQFIRANLALINLHLGSHRGHLTKLCDYLFALNVDTVSGKATVCSRQCFVDAILPIFYRILEVSTDKVAIAEKLISKISDAHATLEKDGPKTFLDSDITLIFLGARLFNNIKMHRRVRSPVLTLLGNLLSIYKPKDSDMAYRLLLLCHAGHMIVEETKRYIPEVLTCLHSLLQWLHHPKSLPASEQYASEPLSVQGPVEAFNLIFPIISLIKKFMTLYSSYPAAIQIFKPIRDELITLKTKPWAFTLPADFDIENFRSIADEIASTIDNFSAVRAPPKTKVSLPKPLKLYEPQFDEVYTGKKRVGSRDKQDRDRLSHKIKQEQKGAIRELKKDSACLARVQQQEQSQLDAARKRKVNLIMGSLSNQEGDFKKIKRGK